MLIVRSLVASCVICGLLACGGEPAESPAPVETTPDPAAERAAEEELTERQRRQNLLRRPFWHDAELVEALGLTETQVSAMETRRQARFEQRRQARIEATSRRADLAAALEAADWENARELGRQLGADSRAALEMDLELKIEILSELDEQQRGLLGRERPSTLRRSWLLPASGRRAQRHNPLLDP